MHELSIAHSIVEAVLQVAERESAPRVLAIHLKIGDLSCVVPSALEFAFEVAAEGTRAQGARLEIVRVPITIHCEPCRTEREVLSPQRFCCSVCGHLGSGIVGGRELEVVSVELEESSVAAG